MPIYILGVGTDPSTWDDLEISNTDIPEEVELDTPFKVSADIVVHSVGRICEENRGSEVWIEKEVAGQYQQLQTVTVDPRKNNGRVEFDLPAEETEGVYHYRLSVKDVDGEMTTLNNTREFAVDVREKSINVLLYGNMLDCEFLDAQAGSSAMMRNDQADLGLPKERRGVLIDGARQEGDAGVFAGVSWG